MNSKRPNNMVTDKIHLAAPGSGANVLSGPINGPNPGPTLAMAVNAADMLVIKSNHKKDNAKVAIAVTIKNKVIKAITSIKALSLIGWPP